MKLDKILLFSSVFLTLVIFCHALEDENSVTAEDHHTAAEENSDAGTQPMTIEEYTLEAEAHARDATFLQENDAVKAIEAYKRAAGVYSGITLIAKNTNLLTEAIDAKTQEAQLYKQAA